MFNRILFAVAFLFSAPFALAQSLNDGPHVIYQQDRIMVKSVDRGSNSLYTLLPEKRTHYVITVDFPEHPEWAFDVKLNPVLNIEPTEYPQPEKIFFLSDIEGEFASFRALLMSNKIIDEKYNWTFGKGHMVICGDLFDRGMDVPECMWLLYKLETAAKAAGGYVHTILGNHDVMNLSGDLRYVQPKYFEAAKLMEVNYMTLYGPTTELGRWLRSKNIIEKIGDNLCAHAGIAPQINKLGLSLQQINDKCRPYYDKAGPGTATAGDENIKTFFSGTTSPFWYRGYFVEPKATEAEVDETLRLFGVKRVVVGHTIVPGNVGLYYSDKVLGLDVNTHRQGGEMQGALISGNSIMVCAEDGAQEPVKSAFSKDRNLTY